MINVLKRFNCLEAISSMSQSNCLHCFELNSYLYHLRSWIKLKKSNPDSCHTSFKFKRKEQFNQELSILKKEFHEKEKEYKKIKNKFEESDLLSKSDDDLRQMFSCLNSGFSEMKKKSPKCFWADCNSS